MARQDMSRKRELFFATKDGGDSRQRCRERLPSTRVDDVGTESLSVVGLVRRIDVGDGVARYEPMRESGEHHHHLVCTECGKVEAFDDPELERAIRRVEAKSGYAVEQHDVVLQGACDSCRA